MSGAKRIEFTMNMIDQALEEYRAFSLFEECFSDLSSKDTGVIEETVYDRLHDLVDEETADTYMRRWFNHQ